MTDIDIAAIRAQHAKVCPNDAVSPCATIALCDEVERLETIAQGLFAIIDDIDSVDDMAKSDDRAYRAIVNRRQKHRFRYATTDGYTVTWRGRTELGLATRATTATTEATND